MRSQGVVVARHRRELEIQTPDQGRRTALLLGRALRPLAGDVVGWRQEEDGTAVIEEILPRRNTLERIDGRGHGEGVAANITMVVVVLAPEPAPDWQLVDHYLAGARLIGADAALLRNKLDINDELLDARLTLYRKLGYPVIATSARQGRGITALAQLLSSHRGVLVGQSGVGKSSLLNALLGEDTQAVGKLSERRALGRHTTTASMLHPLPGGGELIDSPGVRRYAPYIADPAQLDGGFVEFCPLLGQCRFNNCRHINEPGCAIRAACSEARIDPQRYQHYVALRTVLEELHEDQTPR